MGSDTVRKSFKINLAVMSTLRLYPGKKQTCIHKIQGFLTYFVCAVLVSVLNIMKLVKSRKDFDVLQFNLSIAYISEAVCWIFKLLPFLLNGKEVKTCIEYFEHPRFAVTREKQIKIIDDCFRICRRNSLLFLVGIICSAVFFIVTPQFYNNDYKFPINMWLPFNATANYKIYCSVYLLDISTVIYMGMGGLLVDPLIAGLACHATGQLKILKDNLLNLNNYTNEELIKNSKYSYIKNETIRHEIMYNKIKKCIDHHDDILNFVTVYENCFSLAVISQFAGTVFSVCFLCLQIIIATEILNINFISCVLYIPVVLGEIFFYCYYGTNLFEENNTLTDAIYMGDWYNYDSKSKKALLVLMERSKRPMIVTAGKIVPLTLETFTTMLKRTYSLLAVMKNFQ